MKTANYRWNEKVENFNMKLNKLREEINEYKKNSIPVSFLNNKNAFVTKVKHDAKKRELYPVKNDETLKTISKRTNGGCALKEKKITNNNNVIQINIENDNSNNNKNNSNNNNNNNNSGNGNINGMKKNSNIIINNKSKGNNQNVINRQKNTNVKIETKEIVANTNTLTRGINNKATTNGVQMRVQLPQTRAATTKFVKTKTNTNAVIVNEGSFVQNIKDKKKVEKTEQNDKINKINEKKWMAATKHIKIDISNVNENKSVEPKKKNKFLYFEGEDGSVQVYPLYADSDIGFHNITQMDDENLSQVKRENQDDDDIKTTKHLAEWSSELVYKHLKETIEKSKIFFKNKSADNIREDLFRRMYD